MPRSPRRSELRAVRRDCENLLSEFRLPNSCDLAALCQHIAAARGRPLHLVPLAMNSSQPCGMWVSATDADWIFYDADTSPAHQEHIILHEIGHMICCHRGGGHLDDSSAAIFFPDIDPQLVRDMLGRTTYSDTQEQQAEVMAYLLAEFLHAPSPTRHDGDVAARIAGSLDHSARPEQS